MLAKAQRYPLRHNPDFFNTARAVHSPLFTVFFTQTASITQAAIIVPKKAARTAVARNKIKRWLSAALSLLLSQWPNKIFVIVVRRKIEFKDVGELEKLLRQRVM